MIVLSRFHWLPLASLLVAVAGCSSSPADYAQLRELPELNKLCLSAQQVVERTGMQFELVVHEDFNSFVKSKAILNGPNGPQIQQYNWTDDAGAVTGVSCKLKNESHLNPVYGEGTAGPAGVCQDMNRETFRLIAGRVREPAYKTVTFDTDESNTDAGAAIVGGPDWLLPYRMSYVDESGALHVASKAFVQDFGDPRYQAAPEKFRGVHYCHFIAPEYLTALMNGDKEPGAMIGFEIDLSKWPNSNPDQTAPDAAQ